MLALAAMVVWAVAPLFYSRQVNEDFPTADSGAPSGQAAQPTAAPEASAPAQTVQGSRNLQAQGQTPQDQASPTEPSGPPILVRGSFTRVDPLHAAEGTAAIHRLADGKLVLRLEDFKSTNGPDLFVGLSGHPMPRSRRDVHDQGYEQIQMLKANEGNQNYDLPAELDLSKFRSVVIYCRAFSVVFSSAELMPAT